MTAADPLGVRAERMRPQGHKFSLGCNLDDARLVLVVGDE